MAITVCNEIIEGRQANWGKEENTYTRVWYVETNSTLDGAGTACSAVGLNYGDMYNTGTEWDTYSFCKSLQASPYGDDGLSWHVTAQYGALSDKQREDNPLNEPVQYTRGFVNTQAPVWYDVYGNPIRNTAGDCFATQIQKDVSCATLTVSRNLWYDAGSIFLYYVNSVNATWFQGCPPRTWRCMNASVSSQYNKNVGTYFRTSIEFLFNPFRHGVWIESRGVREYDWNTGKLKPVIINGTVCNDPVPLDQNGQRIPPGSGIPPYFMYYEIYPPLPYNIF
jgi:hypothetical protein